MSWPKTPPVGSASGSPSLPAGAWSTRQHTSMHTRPHTRPPPPPHAGKTRPWLGGSEPWPPLVTPWRRRTP